ncbi:hypothetical protein OPQ81_005055 [Rhizoctonia solani]|nr:hypothetical protein OPQ81_005055 [Rhizoctonia solani]
MFDPNLEPSQNLGKFPFLAGVFLDPLTEINESVTEDIYPANELDAHYAGLGWPSPNTLPTKPGDISALGYQLQGPLGTGMWASRRFMLQRAIINLSTEDLRPVEPFVEAVEVALSQETPILQIRALQKVFATWGEVIPLNMVAGACLAVTGILRDGTSLPNSILPTNYPSGAKARVASSGRSVAEDHASWRVVKVQRVAPITDILSEKLRVKVQQLYTTSLIYRSPSVGAPHGFGFEGALHGLRTIERIKIWFSDSRIRDISVKYIGGVVAGPYSFGISNPHTPSDEFILASGEYITDMFVWHHTDGWIAGIQFFKSSLECSPIYGIGDRELISTHAPVLLSGNRKALLGISGTYNADNICQVKAIWRGDVVIRRQRHTQTSFTGALHGFVFNDLQYLADPATSRIVQITARADSSLANLRTTYVSISGGALVRSETPARGTDIGPLQTVTLEDGEYIIGVRGTHNHMWVHQIQFITNKRELPTFGTDQGDVSFSFDAPKTIDGQHMVLHYIAGKACGCVHSLLFVWAEMPLKMTDE